jgi:hypothetical protein
VPPHPLNDPQVVDAVVNRRLALVLTNKVPTADPLNVPPAMFGGRQSPSCRQF